MRIDSVSLDMPFPCDDLIVRIISNGLTWDSASSSRVCIDQDGKCVCAVDFCITEDAIIAIYSSSFVKPVASLAFHTLVSLLVYYNSSVIDLWLSVSPSCLPHHGAATRRAGSALFPARATDAVSGCIDIASHFLG